MKKTIYILTIIMCLSMTACRSHKEYIRDTETVNRRYTDNKNDSFVYEIVDADLRTLDYMTNKGQFTVEATVTYNDKIQRNENGKQISRKKTYTCEDGSIMITQESHSKYTTVLGNLNYSTLHYVNVGSSRVDWPIPYYEKGITNVYKRYEVDPKELCQGIAEHKMVKKMVDLGAQAVFMPIYSWSLKYDDTHSNEETRPVEEGESAKQIKTFAKDDVTIIYKLTITATAVDFLTQKKIVH